MDRWSKAELRHACGSTSARSASSACAKRALDRAKRSACMQTIALARSIHFLAPKGGHRLCFVGKWIKDQSIFIEITKNIDKFGHTEARMAAFNGMLYDHVACIGMRNVSLANVWPLRRRIWQMEFSFDGQRCGYVLRSFDRMNAAWQCWGLPHVHCPATTDGPIARPAVNIHWANILGLYEWVSHLRNVTQSARPWVWYALPAAIINQTFVDYSFALFCSSFVALHPGSSVKEIWENIQFEKQGAIYSLFASFSVCFRRDSRSDRMELVTTQLESASTGFAQFVQQELEP